MPIRTTFDAGQRSGDALVDAQHEALLAQCNRLADACEASADERFDAELERLQALAREHFEAEAARLGGAELEEHRFACDEFEYLAAQVATTANFDRLELQRFLALWCLGHVADTAPLLRPTAPGLSAGTGASAPSRPGPAA